MYKKNRESKKQHCRIIQSIIFNGKIVNEIFKSQVNYVNFDNKQNRLLKPWSILNINNPHSQPQTQHFVISILLDNFVIIYPYCSPLYSFI